MHVEYIYASINKSQLNNGVKSKVNYHKNADSIVCFTRNFFVVVTRIHGLGFYRTLPKYVSIFREFYNLHYWQKVPKKVDCIFESHSGKESLKISIFSNIRNRTQHFKISECFSSWTIIEYRVPQSSILGSLLFDINMIYILY